MKLYYEKPYHKLKLKKIPTAKPFDTRWEQTVLPLGNGELGLSAFGGIRRESIPVNCKSFWAGGPSEKRPNYCGGNILGKDENGKTRYDYFLEIRKLFAEGREQEASKLCDKLVGSKEGYGTYLQFGNLKMRFRKPALFTRSYRRELDLDRAVLTTQTEWGKGIRENHEYFVSYPDKVAVLRVSRAGAPLTCTVSYPAHHGAACQADASGILHVGTLRDNGLRFAAKAEFETDGRLTVNGDTLTVQNATYFCIYLAADTDYLDNYPVYRNGETAEQLQNRILETAKAAKEKGFSVLLQRHLADYQALYCRTCVDLGGGVEMPTDELLCAYAQPNCPAEYKRTLEELLYQYGRYLTIASSRAGDSLPSNLQGIWNCSDAPIWSSDYHLNINLQMNYWPVFTGNLAECAKPLMRYVKALCAPGRVTAAAYTGVKSENGKQNGFLYHTQNTPFGWTCPGWEFSWGWSPVAVAWILHNVFEYYEYTRDKEVLKQDIYPLLCEASNYFESLLMEKDGRLVSCPCFSPEQGPRTMGNTYEQTFLWQLFADTNEAAEALGVDTEQIAHREELMRKLQPIEIGGSGQIKEWYHETALGSVGVKHHRHLSHLLGLYPGNLINRYENPEYIRAAIVSLDDRGDKSTGWAMAQRICARARTCEGDRALQIIGQLIQHGLYVNLWDTHPPFQIDGNFGYTAAVSELLMQSHLGRIELLPALPKDWRSGRVCGLVARGNFELSFAWENGRLTEAAVLSRAGAECKLCTPNVRLRLADPSAVQNYDADGCLVFPTEIGKQYKCIIL